MSKIFISVPRLFQQFMGFSSKGGEDSHTLDKHQNRISSWPNFVANITNTAKLRNLFHLLAGYPHTNLEGRCFVIACGPRGQCTNYCHIGLPKFVLSLLQTHMQENHTALNNAVNSRHYNLPAMTVTYYRGMSQFMSY